MDLRSTNPCSHAYCDEKGLQAGDKPMTIFSPHSAYHHCPSRPEKVLYPVATSGAFTSLCS